MESAVLAFISPGLENFIYAGLGSLITGVWFFVQRRVERKPQLNELEPGERAIKLLKEITEQNLTIEGFYYRREQILNPRKALDGYERKRQEELRKLDEALTRLVDNTKGFLLREHVRDRLTQRAEEAHAAMKEARDALLEKLESRGRLKSLINLFLLPFATAF